MSFWFDNSIVSEVKKKVNLKNKKEKTGPVSRYTTKQKTPNSQETISFEWLEVSKGDVYMRAGPKIKTDCYFTLI